MAIAEYLLDGRRTVVGSPPNRSTLLTCTCLRHGALSTLEGEGGRARRPSGQTSGRGASTLGPRSGALSAAPGSVSNQTRYSAGSMRAVRSGRWPRVRRFSSGPGVPTASHPVNVTAADVTGRDLIGSSRRVDRRVRRERIHGAVAQFPSPAGVEKVGVGDGQTFGLLAATHKFREPGDVVGIILAHGDLW